MENDHRIYATRNREYWGPIYWSFLYLTVMGFPVSLTNAQNREFSNLIKNFHVFLPCAECRNHYKKEVEKVNFDIKNKNTAMDIVLHLHNSVRKRQNKRLFTADGVFAYHHLKASSTHMKYVAVLLFCVIIAIALYFTLYR